MPDNVFDDIRVDVPAVYHEDGSLKKAATVLPIKLLKKGVSSV